MHVGICKDPVQWDAFVENHPSAYNYHRWCWRQVIEDTFGHPSYYLAASESGVLKGILPLFSIRSRLFGSSLVSMPFFTYGGVLADSRESSEALTKTAAELAGELKAQHVELRQGSDLHCGWQRLTPKLTMQMALPQKVDDLWKRFSTGHRNKIRKGQKSGFRIQWGGAGAVGDFYRVFAANMRNLGTPVYPRKFFEAIRKQYPGQTEILTLWEGKKVIAAAFLSSYKGMLELPWSASLPDLRKKYSHYLMYWTVMEWAIKNGLCRLDLGRSTPGSGTHDFKRHWICEEVPLAWYYWVAPGSGLPEVNTNNPRFHAAIQIWKRLPLRVANSLGPRIVRGLP